MKSAIAHHQSGRFGDAERIYRRIISQHPRHADALHMCGVVCAQTGRFDAAVELIDRAIAIHPSGPNYYRNLANALKDSGQSQRAIKAFAQALCLQPADAEAHNQLGILLLAAEQFDDAVSAFRQAVRYKPTHAEAWNNLGMALAAVTHLDEAIDVYRRSISLQPMPQTWNNLGNAHKKKEQLDQAIEAYRVAARLSPDSAEIHNNLGLSLRDNGFVDEAIVNLGRAVKLKPDMASAHWNLSLALLLNGELVRGWTEYEWRWKWKDFPVPAPRYSQPQWRGEELDGRTILLHVEQGRGDVIQFIRYAQLIADRGGKVVLHCPKEIVRLMKGVPGVHHITSTAECPAFELHSPLLSLPTAFATSLETIPASVPYLFPDKDLAAEWGARMGLVHSPLSTGATEAQISAAGALTGRIPATEPPAGTPRLRVGLVWAGNPTHGNDRKRSIALSQLSPLARVPGVTFYSLQKGDSASQAANPPPGMQMFDFTQELEDFADTAAMISHLDLIITVDTAVAHLAGAMGKTVWVLLPLVPDWRWLLDRDNTPWYPTMRLFRQKGSEQWVPVIERIAEALGESAK